MLWIVAPCCTFLPLVVENCQQNKKDSGWAILYQCLRQKLLAKVLYCTYTHSDTWLWFTPLKMWLQKGEVLFSRQSEPRIGCLESELRGPQPRSDAPQFPLYAPPSARASWKMPTIAPSWMGSPQPCFKRQSTSANATVKWSRCRTGNSCWINSWVKLAVRTHLEYSSFEAILV